MADPRRGARSNKRGLKGGVVVACLAAAWLVLVIFSMPSGPHHVEPGTEVFERPQSRAEVLVGQMDGQVFAQHAVDPTMARFVDEYQGNAPEAAYRAMRPVQGWVNWAASLGGQRALLAPAILAVGIVALALIPSLLDAVGASLGLTARYPILILLAPPTLAFLRWPGLCEPLAAVVTLAALATWMRGRVPLSIALFCVAALTRETTLLIPIGLGLATLWQERRLRPTLPLAVPALAYAAWAIVVRLRIGVAPTGSAQMSGPFVGLLKAVPQWRTPEIVTAIVLIAACATLWKTRDVYLRAIVVAHLGFLAFVGPLVWWYWWGFGRVTVVLLALALLHRETSTSAEIETLDLIEPALVGSSVFTSSQLDELPSRVSTGWRPA